MPQVAFIRKKLYDSLGGFDKLTRCLNFLKADKGNCTATFVVQECHTNNFKTLHGGFSAALIDNISTLGLYTHKFGNSPSVSINLSVNFYKPAFLGDELLFEMKTKRVGKSVAFLEVEVFNKATEQLLMKGTHTKHIFGEDVATNPNKPKVEEKE